MRETSFYFYSEPTIELTEVRRDGGASGHSDIWCVRGKTTGPFEASGTFQWTRAVQAFCLLLVRYVLFSNGGVISGNSHCLSGGQGTLAACLDNAVRKDAQWLINMFGSNSSGMPISRYLFVKSNGGLKRAGPVTVGINEKILPLYAIKLYMDGVQLSSLDSVKALLVSLESSYSDQSNQPLAANS